MGPVSAALIEQGQKLTGTATVQKSLFGASVALSADGNTALIGAPAENGGHGAAWVFTRVGATWTQQGEALTGGGENGQGAFGSSVALSADGDTALVGGPADDSGIGAVWVFTRSGNVWLQQGGKLTGEGQFGFSVAISADGDTAAIGAPSDDGGRGGLWLSTRSGSTWSQPYQPYSGEEGFGSSVAVSSDGQTFLVGEPYAEGEHGIAFLLTRLRPLAEFTGKGEHSAANFGTSVALSSTAETVLVGAPNEDGGGAAWVFAGKGENWTQGEKLTGAGESGSAGFGTSVALSSDGRAALVGAPYDEGGTGAAWTFTQAQEGWQQDERLTGSLESGDGWFGTSVAFSADSGTVLVGGKDDHEAAGAAWPFGRYQAPGATTAGVSTFSENTATLTGAVDPRGLPAEVHFQYGPTAAYGQNTANQLLSAGESSVPIDLEIGGLQPSTVYHFRIVAETAAGTSVGADQTFTTSPSHTAVGVTPAPVAPINPPTAISPSPRVESRMRWRFGWFKRYTVVHALEVRAVPVGGWVEMFCSGHGCPFAHRRSATVPSGTTCRSGKCVSRHPQGPVIDLARFFKGRRLAVGTRIVVNVLKPGWIGKSFVFTIRAGKEPEPRVGNST